MGIYNENTFTEIVQMNLNLIYLELLCFKVSTSQHFIFLTTFM